MCAIRFRLLALATVAVAASVGLSGCGLQSPVSPRVLSIAQARSRYLDAMCPLLADPSFWRSSSGEAPASARAAASALLPAAERSVTLLAKPPRPWPGLMTRSVATLTAAVTTNTRRLRAVGAAEDASALATAPAPVAVPQDAIDRIEGLLYVSARSGSPNCTGHGGPSASPTPTP